MRGKYSDGVYRIRRQEYGGGTSGQLTPDQGLTRRRAGEKGAEEEILKNPNFLIRVKQGSGETKQLAQHGVGRDRSTG